MKFGDATAEEEIKGPKILERQPLKREFAQKILAKSEEEMNLLRLLVIPNKAKKQKKLNLREKIKPRIYPSAKTERLKLGIEKHETVQHINLHYATKQEATTGSQLQTKSQTK